VVRPALTRSAERRAFAALFADDPLAAVLTVLQAGEGGVSAEQVKHALVERGVGAEAAMRGWRRVQARLAAHERVSVEGVRYRRTYRYLPEPPAPTPAQALELLQGHRLPAARRAELAEIVRSALASSQDSPAGVARLEQREKDAVRALAEMAIEVEELAVNEASTRAVVHTVRALTKVAQLRPIEGAGTSTRFDRTRHTSVGGYIADGAAVVVIRPGYVWHRPDGDILIAKAVVQDRSAR
jgi:hypothetical protein